MKITVEFESIEEFEAFRTSGKKTRGGKGKDDGEAETPAPTTAVPAPAMPPASPAMGFNPGATTGFVPPAPGAVPAGGAFPAAAAPAVAPEVQAIVARINARIDSAIAGGQPADAALQWLRGQCGPDAAAYTMDQVKQVALPKLAMPQLEQIAKLMAA